MERSLIPFITVVLFSVAIATSCTKNEAIGTNDSNIEYPFDFTSTRSGFGDIDWIGAKWIVKASMIYHKGEWTPASEFDGDGTMVFELFDDGTAIISDHLTGKEFSPEYKWERNDSTSFQIGPLEYTVLFVSFPTRFYAVSKNNSDFIYKFEVL